MKGKPRHIHLIPEVILHACHTPVPVPKHWAMEMKRQIDEDVRKGVLEPMLTGEATALCVRMMVVAKARIVMVNHQLPEVGCCLLETHHTLMLFNMVSGIPCHIYKTTADANWGFHWVELEASRKLTTFITLWGRYQ